MKKDYDAIVEVDWKQVEQDMKTIMSASLASSLKNDGVFIPPALGRNKAGITSDATYEGYSRFVVSTEFDTSPHISKDEIRKILNGAPDDLIDRVASALMPTDIEKNWQENHYPFMKLKWLRGQLKQLNQLIKQHGFHHKWLQKQLDNKKYPLPHPLRTELQTSANALKDSVELARAYIRLFERQKTRWRTNGEEYAQLTRNPYWSTIINAVAALVYETHADRNCFLMSDTSPYRLIADLLHLAYPWVWKNDLNTLKLLRERV